MDRKFVTKVYILTFGGTSFYLLFVEFYTNKIITNVLYFPTEKFEQYLLNLLV